jgi:hypothetical protein
VTQQVRISHPELLSFANWTAPGNSTESSGQVLAWHSEELATPTLTACIATFDDARCFNAIRIEVHEEFADFFPNTFRFEISQDGHIWEPILQESDFRAGLAGRAAWNFPLISARHLKFLFLADRQNEAGKYFAAFAAFRVMISGIVDLDVSSELDRLWVKQNLIDERPEYGWSSSLKAKREEEYAVVDLGSVNKVSEVRMLSKNDAETFFPEVFGLAYSEDNIAWHHLLEETGFLSESGVWYRWRFMPTNMRFLRIAITEGARTREGKYVSQIIELEMFATPDVLESPGRSYSEPINHASVLRSGIVRLAMDGETGEGLAVQASDRRLMDATVEARGIVELATDGEDAALVAVQGNDRRLKYSTEDLPGIVRLARDGEARAGHVVQSNDARLRGATEEAAGLVELGEDGENRPGVAVQGNDRRLRLATTQAPGIVTLAENGAVRPNEAVQGDDHRLRDATVEHKGILRFARPGEDVAEVAVQASDPRLKPATGEARGIVELALDGEDREGVVVQGNDRRLKAATEEQAGIVELAAPGSELKGRVVQANDPRLSDARPPLPHEHDYASAEHDFDSHSGVLKVEAECGDQYAALAPPPLGHAPVTGINSGKGAAVVGKGRADGVVGSAVDGSGTVGFATGAGAGALGAGREGPGGAFYSERTYGLVAGGGDENRGLAASVLALYARGLSRFDDTAYLKQGASCIAMYFPVQDRDVLSPGDLVVSRADRLEKSRDYGNTQVIGVVVEDAGLVLNPPDGHLPGVAAGEKGFYSPAKPRGMELVAVMGVVQVRATAEKRPIHPGDLLVASIQSGYVERLDDTKTDRQRPGMLVARSLGELKKGEGQLSVLLISG